MVHSFGTPPPRYDASWLMRVLDTIRRSLADFVNKNEATRRIILLSPNGTSYDVTVDDAGTLQTTVNAGKNRPS
jgi:hypothetical protein